MKEACVHPCRSRYVITLCTVSLVSVIVMSVHYCALPSLCHVTRQLDSASHHAPAHVLSSHPEHHHPPPRSKETSGGRCGGECQIEHTQRDTTCTTFRDVSSDEGEIQMAKFPGIISTCGDNTPRLASRAMVNRSSNTRTAGTETVVPNVVHYVWFGPPLNMSFLNYLSVRSVDRFLKPQYIFIHGDSTPAGQWWEKAIGSIPNIYLVNRTKAANISGKIPYALQHYSDVARLEILLDYGGIYFDWDSLAVRSFDPLLKYDVTLGRQTPTKLANGLIIAKRSAAFLRIWLETYHTFQVKEWDKHSCEVPHKLQQIFPHLIHVEETSLARPHASEKNLFFYGHYPWRKNNFAIHVWKRHGPVPETSEDLKSVNSTLWEVMRHSLYDD